MSNAYLSGEEILNKYDDIKHLIDFGYKHHVDMLIESLGTYADTLNEVSVEQRSNLKKLFWDLRKGDRVRAWSRLARGNVERQPFIKSIHPAIACAITDAFGVPCGPKGIGVIPVDPTDAASEGDHDQA